MPGIKVRVAVMELQFARDAWIVVSPAGISGPFYLPRSHHAWEPMATAESYAETKQCNRYAYRFGGLQLPARRRHVADDAASREAAGSGLEAAPPRRLRVQRHRRLSGATLPTAATARCGVV